MNSRPVPALMVAAILLAGCAQSTPSAAPPYQTLYPESHPATIAVCRQRVQLPGGPDIANLSCGHGALNAAAWNLYLYDKSELMRLPRRASVSQIERAGCKTSGNYTGSELIQIYQLVAAYNGWKFRQAVANYLYAHCA